MRQATLLGVEADDPGSVWVERGAAWIQQRTPRPYSSLDIEVTGESGVKLVIALAARDVAAPRQITREVSLAQLLNSSCEGDLDDRANRLLIRRAPGDSLRLTLEPRSLVFAPGEAFRAQLQPVAVTKESDASLRYRIFLKEVATGNEMRISDDAQAASAAGPLTIPLEFRVPNAEGAYRLVVEAIPRELRAQIGLARVLAQRSLDFVVVGSVPQPALTSASWSVVTELDPANPAWWKRLTEMPLPILRRGPLDSGDVKTVDHPLGRVTQLAAQAKDAEAPWAAYTLPLTATGQPHILEIEYPGNVPQSVGISIVEPNAAGQVVPIGLDSGFHVSNETAEHAADWQKHRVVFWPKTTAPLALVTNRRPGTPAVYGKLRVLAGPPRLPRAAALDSTAGRPIWAYLEKPYFAKSFSAAEEADADSQRALESWLTFYQGGTRLVDYLQHTGHTGLMLAVACDGGTIYPSTVLQANTRYDSGAYFGQACDPQGKDGLEMLLRLFDRERLQLVPIVDFTTPLPELEAVLRAGGRTAEGVAWIGPDGRSWLETNAPVDGLAPYYNVLNPRVQDAMRRVIGELITRYGHHPSFAGLSLRLLPDGYLLMPGTEWGLDDATIEQFQRDTRITVPGEGPGRFQERAKHVTGPQRAAWLGWRSDRLCKFLQSLQRDLAIARFDAQRRTPQLYLDAARLLDAPRVARRLRPTLPSQTAIGDVLAELGLDPAQLRNLRDVVLLEPRHISPSGAVRPGAADYEGEHLPSLAAMLADMPQAVQFYHPPQALRLSSFDKVSPFKNTFTWMVTQSSPSGMENRQRLAHALADRDRLLMVDGGRLLPLGQQDASRDWLLVYRQLPAVPFQTVDAGKTQPVTFRVASYENRTWWYAVNDSPWPVRFRLRTAAKEPMQEIGAASPVEGTPDDQGASWDLGFEPYQLRAGWFDSADVRFPAGSVQLPEDVAPRLERRIGDLAGRVAMLKSQPPSDLVTNADFEAPPIRAGEIAGWVATRQAGVTIDLDRTSPQRGNFATMVSSSGPVASLACEPFAPPSSGRLRVLVHLRIADEARQPVFRIAVEGTLDGKPYYRHAPVGAQSTRPIRAAWEPFVFVMDDLPRDALTQLRVRFDLMGEGQVWVDNVQVSTLHFSDDEETELLTMVQAAVVSLQEGKVSNVRRLLSGYWLKLLERELPAPPRTSTPIPVRPVPLPAESPPPAQASPQDPGLLDRAKNWLPSWMRF